MDTMFTFEESSLIGIYAGGGRREVIVDIEKALPYIDDTDMAELCQRVIGKLRDMADDEFERIELIEGE